MKRFVLFSILAAVMLSGCAAKLLVSAPDWVTGPEVFVANGYVYAVGKSDVADKDVSMARSIASLDARTKITRYIKDGKIPGLTESNLYLSYQAATFFRRGNIEFVLMKMPLSLAEKK